MSKRLFLGIFLVVLGSFVFQAANAAITKIEESWESTGGNQTGAIFGYSSASAGDVNHDGYADAVVGSPSYNSGGGRVDLFLGSAAGLNTSSTWTALGSGSDALGMSVASAGDVNFDGYSDVIIGAEGVNSYAGAAFLFLGEANGLGTSPILVGSGENGNEFYGFSVASAGDVNNDGYDDVIVGAYKYNNGSGAGRAYLYLGSASGINTTAVWTATGEHAVGTNDGDWFGRRVKGIGDINKDGYDDVAVGADKYHLNYGQPDEQADSGKVYIYLGSASGLNSSAYWTSTGDSQAGARFGMSVAGGDVNGDEYQDVIVGAHQYTTANSQAGKIYVYYGSASGLATTPGWTTSGDDQADAWFGYSSSSLDVNADGYGDIIVGAVRYDQIRTNNGKIYLYLGSPSGLVSSPEWTTYGTNQNTDALGERFGISVASGDVNNDGYDEIITGAEGYEQNIGRATLYTNQASFSVLIDDGADYTLTRKIDLFLSASTISSPSQMIISENADFAGASWESFATFKSFILSSLSGQKTIYVKFRNEGGAESKIVSDTIRYISKPKFVTKSASGSNEVLIEKGQIYSVNDLSFVFKKLPRKLLKKKYYLKIFKYNKYPLKYKKAKRICLKKYWKITTNLNKYRAKNKKQQFKIKFVFSYSKAEFRKLKKKGIKQNALQMKYYDKKNREWKIVGGVKHKKSARKFSMVVKKFNFENNLFMIAKK